MHESDLWFSALRKYKFQWKLFISDRNRAIIFMHVKRESSKWNEKVVESDKIFGNKM